MVLLTLSVPRSEPAFFPTAKLEENCELRRTDNVQGQISEHIIFLKSNGGYCIYYPLNMFTNSLPLKTFTVYEVDFFGVFRPGPNWITLSTG